jgi:hypothetical protein
MSPVFKRISFPLACQIGIVLCNIASSIAMLEVSRSWGFVVIWGLADQIAPSVNPALEAAALILTPWLMIGFVILISQWLFVRGRVLLAVIAGFFPIVCEGLFLLWWEK